MSTSSTAGTSVSGLVRYGRRFDSSRQDLLPEKLFVAPVLFLLAKMLADCRQMERQRVQQRRSKNYRRLSGGAELDSSH